MHTIYKYRLRITDEQTVIMPMNATPLSVGLDPVGDVCVWADVNSDAPALEERVFLIVGTGNPVPERRKTFIGSVTQPPFVWHVYEATGL